MKIKGLTDVQLRQVQEVLSQIPNLERAVIFGSRSTGKYKNNSDIDIALFGGKVSFGAIFDIEDALYNKGFELELDIVLVSIIQDTRFKAAIERTGFDVFPK